MYFNQQSIKIEFNIILLVFINVIIVMVMMVTQITLRTFDGDEMNIHSPQSIQARNELQRLANVKYHIIGAKDSKVETFTSHSLG